MLLGRVRAAHDARNNDARSCDGWTRLLAFWALDTTSSSCSADHAHSSGSATPVGKLAHRIPTPPRQGTLCLTMCRWQYRAAGAVHLTLSSTSVRQTTGMFHGAFQHRLPRMPCAPSFAPFRISPDWGTALRAAAGQSRAHLLCTAEHPCRLSVAIVRRSCGMLLDSREA